MAAQNLAFFSCFDKYVHIEGTRAWCLIEIESAVLAYPGSLRENVQACDLGSTS